MNSQDLSKSVVLITSKLSDREDSGTGFIIGKKEQKTYLLTCFHVVKNVDRPGNIILAAGKQARVISSIDKSENFDLAVLEVEGLDERHPLSLRAVWKKKDFIIRGFHKYDQRNKRGEIKGKLGKTTESLSKDGQHSRREWDLIINEGEQLLERGYSGSPVIDTVTNSVLGVVSHRSGRSGTGLAISIEALKKILPPILEDLIKIDEENNSPSSSNPGSSKKLDRGEVFDNIIDATFYMQRQAEQIKDLQTQLRYNRFLPCHYFYVSDSGRENWLSLCQNEEYKFYRESVEFLKKEKDRILEAVGEDTIKAGPDQSGPDYISLGPGTGSKDGILLKAFYESLNSNDVYYYPYDINPTMIAKAIKKISNDHNDFFRRKRIKIKAMVADFDYLQDFKPVYEYRPAPNIFTFLGNTLGSYEKDSDLLKQIKNAMNPKDILLLEVRLLAGIPNIEKVKPDGDSETIKKFNFEPLTWLGVTYDENDVDYDEEEETVFSQIKNTRTIFCFYKGKIPRIDTPAEKILLSCVHYYDENKLSTHLREKIGFHIEATIKNTFNTIALYVLRK